MVLNKDLEPVSREKMTASPILTPKKASPIRVRDIRDRQGGSLVPSLYGKLPTL